MALTMGTVAAISLIHVESPSLCVFLCIQSLTECSSTIYVIM